MSTPTCRFCRHVNPAGAKFCNECGSPLHLRPCPSCEAITDASAQACHQCGASLAGDTVLAPALALPAGEAALAPAAHAVPADDAAGKDRRHVPESLAECLDARVGAPAPFMRPSSRVESKTPLEGAMVERANDVSPRSADIRHVAASDGAEMIADDALTRAHGSPDGARAARVERADRADARTIVGAAIHGGDTARRATRDASGDSLGLALDAADRPARLPRRSHRLHPVAWGVVVAALGGVGYFAYVEHAPWTSWLAGVTAMVRGASSPTVQDAPAPPVSDGREATTTTAAPVVPRPAATTGGVADRRPDASSSRAAAGPDGGRAATQHTAGDPGSAATGATPVDAATARRAAASSQAPTAARSAGAVAIPATSDRTSSPTRAAANTGVSKGGARKTTTTRATTATGDDAGRPAETTKPTEADALATQRVIERELGGFLPRDTKRPPQGERATD